MTCGELYTREAAAVSLHMRLTHPFRSVPLSVNCRITRPGFLIQFWDGKLALEEGTIRLVCFSE